MYTGCSVRERSSYPSIPRERLHSTVHPPLTASGTQCASWFVWQLPAYTTFGPLMPSSRHVLYDVFSHTQHTVASLMVTLAAYATKPSGTAMAVARTTRFVLAAPRRLHRALVRRMENLLLCRKHAWRAAAPPVAGPRIPQRGGGQAVVAQKVKKCAQGPSGPREVAAPPAAPLKKSKLSPGTSTTSRNQALLRLLKKEGLSPGPPARPATARGCACPDGSSPARTSRWGCGCGRRPGQSPAESCPGQECS